MLLLLCGFAQGQDHITRLVLADTAPLLQHADPQIRGEAALVIARYADATQQALLLAMANSDDVASRHRARIALGLLGTPAAVQLLGDCLDDTGTRGEDDGTAAAFGLGLCPTATATTPTTRLLAAIAQGSWKRQRDTLLALLLAMSLAPERTETVALRRLFDDESNRDPQVRGQLLQLLLTNDRTLDNKTLRKLLERGSEAERAVLLRWLADEAPAMDAAWLALLEPLARSAERGETRALALGVLTNARHLPSLELAERALRHGTAIECEVALRAMLLIGGARLLRATTPLVLSESDPARKAAMLASFAAPLPDELKDHCSKLAADAREPWSLRSEAALALARGDGPRAAPLLRSVFATTPQTTDLMRLARALRQPGAEPISIARLLDDSDLRLHPAHWIALLQAEHPEAQRQVLANLRLDRASPATLLTTLRVWRYARVLSVPTARCDAVPPLLQMLLACP